MLNIVLLIIIILLSITLLITLMMLSIFPLLILTIILTIIITITIHQRIHRRSHIPLRQLFRRERIEQRVTIHMHHLDHLSFLPITPIQQPLPDASPLRNHSHNRTQPQMASDCGTFQSPPPSSAAGLEVPQPTTHAPTKSMQEPQFPEPSDPHHP